MKKLLLTVLTAILAQAASAQNVQVREVTASWWRMGWYSTGQTLVHRFDTPTYVERMLISAEGHRNFAKAFVYADGDQVALLGVPGRDPDYPVIVRKTISSIVIKFEGDVRILDFRIYMAEGAQESFNRYAVGNLETPAQIGRAVLKAVAELQNVVSDSEFRTFLLPLRQNALILAAKGQGRPLLSDNTQQQARVMVNQIKRAEMFLLNRLAYNEYFTDQVQILLYAKEKLESVYEIR